MPYCPDCRTEYRDGLTRCADCGAVLLAGPLPEMEGAPAAPPSPPMDMSPESEPAFLCRVADPSEVEIICAALREAGIPCMTQGFGPITGGLALVTDGGAPEDYTTIRVPGNRLGEAEQVLTAFRCAPVEWPTGLEPEG